MTHADPVTAALWRPLSELPPLQNRIGPQAPNGAQRSTLAFTPVQLIDPEAAGQWHLSMLGDIEAVWKDFTGKGVSVGVYDTGVQYAHWDLDNNYEVSRHVVVDGYTYDGDWDAKSDDPVHGTAVAGLIAAERNGRGGMGVGHEASITSVNIFHRYSEGGEKPGIYIGSDDLTKFLSAFDQAARFDVVNHSWGGTHGYSSQSSRGVEGSILHRFATSMAHAAEVGREGLGTIVVNASGNGTTLFFGATHEQSDSWKSDRHAITVGAYRGDNGSATFYSFGGPHLLVSAPSGDFSFLDSSRDITTTDLLGYWGANMKATPGGKDDYTDSFSGTSAATPIVTGVVTLMLDANEGLGWRDVSNILAASARMPVAFGTKPTIVTATGEGAVPIFFEKGGDYTLNNSTFKLGGSDAGWNGGRMHYSTDYGYGAVDAYAAVRMAEVWSLFDAAKTSRNEVVVDSGTIALDLAVPPFRPDTVQPGPVYHDFVGNDFASKERPAATFVVGRNIATEHVDITLDVLNLVEGWVTDPVTGEEMLQDVPIAITGLRFKVIAPDGTSAFMDTYASAEDAVEGSQQFTFGLAAFRGVETAGTWRVEFETLAGMFDNRITIQSMRFNAYGSRASADDVHTFTDEFFTMAAIDGEAGRRTIADIDGGTDWINAAAVTADVALDLAAGATTKFSGVDAFTIGRTSGIENAVTGDGNDRLIGNALHNRLYGMRGDDWLNGGAGNDTLFGGTGNEVFAFDTAGVSGHDRILDWSAGDRIATSKQLRGADQNGLLTVGSNALLLLDNTARGDTAELVGQGGAVLRAIGKADGYWWYSFVSDGVENFVDGCVRELALGHSQVANDLGAAGLMGSAMTTGPDASAMQNTAFFLYDTMGASMASGVQVFA